MLPPESNDILALLPADERAQLVSRAEYRLLDQRYLLIEAEKPIEWVYFIVDGIASVLSVMSDATGVETATVGRDGMIGIEVFHGVGVATEQTMTQVAGAAYRIPADEFGKLVGELPELRRLLHRFSVMMFTFAAQNSGCNRKHPVEMRCARWLLTVSENLRRPDLGLTHEFISQMLGVRRATVTDTLAAFERRKLVTVGRGRITLEDIDGLEGATCECHQIIRATRARLMGGPTASSPLRDVILSKGEHSIVSAPHS